MNGQEKKKFVYASIYRIDIWRIIVFEFFFLETDQVGWTQEPRQLGWQKQYEHIIRAKSSHKAKKKKSYLFLFLF